MPPKLQAGSASRGFEQMIRVPWQSPSMCITVARRPCVTTNSNPCATKTCITLEERVLYLLHLWTFSAAFVVLVNAYVAPGHPSFGRQNTEEPHLARAGGLPLGKVRPRLLGEQAKLQRRNSDEVLCSKGSSGRVGSVVVRQTERGVDTCTG